MQALAGPAAGPNGGQIYIDGFAGGQIPPKSSILEVRVNQNPFSAEFDRIGYGRVEIITKPGSQKFQGSVNGYGDTSALNTANPLVTQQPSYYQYSIGGNLAGPISKNASYFFNGFYASRQNQSMVDAINPLNTSAGITEAFPAPIDYLSVNPRLDLQLGSINTVTIRDSFYRCLLYTSRRGKPDVARPELAAATTLDPGEAGPALKARAWRALAQIDRPHPSGEGDYSAASNDLIEALKISPETEDDTLLAAALAEDAGQYDAAESAYRRVLAKYPKSEPATTALAHLCLLYTSLRTCCSGRPAR